MIEIFAVIAVIGVFIGSITDIKTLEVPDWLNYSMIAIGLAGNLIWTITYSDWLFFLRSLFGLFVAFLVGMLMYYTGQWGGGDSKMLFGLGALFGLDYPLQISFFPKFVVNLLFFGAIYGLMWIIALAIKNRIKINRLFIKELKRNKTFRLYFGLFSILLALIIYFLPINSYIKLVALIIIGFMYFTNYMFIYVRIVEKISMVKWIDPVKLTEGDWIVDDIKIDKKIIAGPKDLGIKKEQIETLLKLKEQGKISKIKVKYGIPFVPSFFLALIYTIIFGNILMFSFL